MERHKEIEGEGFTAREADTSYASDTHPVEFRTGESNEDAIDRSEAEAARATELERLRDELEASLPAEERERLVAERDLRHDASLVASFLKPFATYAERLRLKEDGTLDHSERFGAVIDGESVTGGIPFAFYLTEATPEDLMRLAHVLQEDYAMSFTFERDPEGRWFEYSLKRD